MIVPVTNYLSLDEPCFTLREEDRSNGQGQRRRFRIFAVIRNDGLAEHWEDLGPTKSFKKVHPVRILGGVRDPDTGRIWIEHTAGELLDILHASRKRTWEKWERKNNSN
jgi:hypothetical protein